jgi:hypothetical protein
MKIGDAMGKKMQSPCNTEFEQSECNEPTTADTKGTRSILNMTMDSENQISSTSFGQKGDLQNEKNL